MKEILDIAIVVTASFGVAYVAWKMAQGLMEIDTAERLIRSRKKAKQ